jgi:hypothetical protein
MRLTKHFTLHELTASQTASRLGIDNVPTLEEIERLKDVCSFILERCRMHFNRPITPSSGFRGPKLNKAVNGSENSQHCRGEAVDFTVAGVPNLELAEWIRDHCEFDQLILEYPTEDPFAGWVHCSYKATGNRGEVLTATRNGYKKGLVT